MENLADNAAKFTHQGGIRFAAAAEPARGKRVRLVFTVADSGIGMSAAEVKQLFRPFTQASAEIARRYGGAGLGLTFVKRIAKAMGGDLTVTSAKGKGSTFRLTALVDRVERPASPREPSHSQGRALRLLCAEDNPYGRVIMNTILGELGHRVDFVASGEAAVEAAARGGHDAVLMDVTLAGLDGIEATRRIRALPGRGRPRAGDRHLRPRPQRRRTGGPGRWHERVPREAGEPVEAGGGVGDVITGLVPVIPTGMALCLPKRDGRDKYPAMTKNYSRLVLALDDPHQVAHDAVELEILRRVDGGDAGLLQFGRRPPAG